MKLYFTPNACSQAVHIVAREAGLPLELAKVDLMTHKLEDGSDYYTVNPRGYVPLLELDDGSRHTEVSALIQYLADQDPTGRLLPEVGTRERFEAQQWITFVSSELHKAFSPWLWHKETADSTVKAVKDKLATRFAELDRHLATRSYLLGEQFTAADAYCYVIVNWSHLLGIGLKGYPALSAYLKRVAARPKVREVLVAEGLLKA
jgi:glutathione S-transferase